MSDIGMTHTIIEFPERLSMAEAIDLIFDARAQHPNPNHPDAFRLAAGCTLIDVPVFDDRGKPVGTEEVTTKPGDRLATIPFV